VLRERARALARFGMRSLVGGVGSGFGRCCVFVEHGWFCASGQGCVCVVATDNSPPSGLFCPLPLLLSVYIKHLFRFALLRSPRLSGTLASGANDACRRFTCHLASTHQATVLAQDLC